jgi:multidrug resistance protein, MATE family
MTTPESDNAAGATAPPHRPPWRLELTETVQLALPIAMTQLGQIAMMTTDLALVGRLGDTALAGAALAHIILFGRSCLGWV